MKDEPCSSEKEKLFSFVRSPLTSALFWREMRSGGWNYVLLTFAALLIISFCCMYWNANRDITKMGSYMGNGVWRVLIPSLLLFLPSFVLFKNREEASGSMLEILMLSASSGLRLGGCLWSVVLLRVLSLAFVAFPFIVLQIYVNGGSMQVGCCFFVFLVLLSLFLTSFSLWLARFSVLFKIIYIGLLLLMASLADDFIFTQILHYNYRVKSWVETLFSNGHAPRLCFFFLLGSCFFVLSSLGILAQYCSRFASAREDVSGSLRRILSGFTILPLMCFFMLLWKEPGDAMVVNVIIIFSFAAIFIFSIFDMQRDGAGIMRQGGMPEKEKCKWARMLFKPGWSNAGLYLLTSSIVVSFWVWGMKIFLFPALSIISNNRVPMVFVLLSANYLVVFYLLRRWLGQVSSLVSLMIVLFSFVISFSINSWAIIEQNSFMKIISGGIPLLNFVKYLESSERLWGNLFFIIFVFLLYIKKSCSLYQKKTH